MHIESSTIAAGLLLYRARPADSFYQQFVQKMQAEPDSAKAAQEAMGQIAVQHSRQNGDTVAQQLQFASLLATAYSKNAQQDARAYLQTLDKAQLAILQRNKYLADEIRPEALSEEGARNLLLPHGYAVDLDGDRNLEIGISNTWSVPPQDAPPEFLTAWGETMGKLPWEVRSSAESGLILGIYGLNLDGDLPRLVPREDRPSTQMSSYRTAIIEELERLRAHPELTPMHYQEKLDAWRNLAIRLGMDPDKRA